MTLGSVGVGDVEHSSRSKMSPIPHLPLPSVMGHRHLLMQGMVTSWEGKL